MYLKRIWLKNTGPIAQLDVEMPFSEDGLPKPVILVGSNGAGKTSALSYVTDALIEIAKKHYQDIVPAQGLNTPYFRVVGGNNTKLGEKNSFAILLFEVSKDSVLHKIIYREQIGEDTPYD